jgi:hypothetical protein
MSATFVGIVGDRLGLAIAEQVFDRRMTCRQQILAAGPFKFNSANLICVAASNQRDKLTTFSNFGPKSVDLAAPGENVLGAYPPHAISYDLNEFFDEPLADPSSPAAGTTNGV